MRAGRLRHRIRIERETVTRNDFGEEINDWRVIATRWARVAPQGGREYWAAEQVNDELTHEVRLRFLPGIRAKDRVVFRGRVFDITAVVNVGELDRELILFCTER